MKKEKENNVFCTSLDRDNQITTSAKLLDIMYESYGFSTDLIETINTNEYQCGKVGFSMKKTVSIVMRKILKVVSHFLNTYVLILLSLATIHYHLS